MTATIADPAVAFDATLSALHGRVSVDLGRLGATVDSTQLAAMSIMELRAQLAATIYTHLHIDHPGIENLHTTGPQDLADSLIAGIPHPDVVHRATAFAPEIHLVNGARHRTAELAGVRVLVPLDDIARAQDGSEIGVRIPSWRTRTTPGYLVALGAAGGIDPAAVARLYIAAGSADDVLPVWPELLTALASMGVAYQAKALSASRAYPRSDAVVVYVAASVATTVAEALTPLLPAVRIPPTPASIFTLPVTDRITTATEPADSRASHRGLSFGQHRSRVLADAVLRAASEGCSLKAAWKVEARQAHIDPDHPARNLIG